MSAKAKVKIDASAVAVATLVSSAAASSADRAQFLLRAGAGVHAALGGKAARGALQAYRDDVLLPNVKRAAEQPDATEAVKRANAYLHSLKPDSLKVTLSRSFTSYSRAVHPRVKGRTAKERAASESKVIEELTPQGATLEAIHDAVKEKRTRRGGKRTAVQLEEDAMRLLNEVMESLKADGKGSTASDAVRFLHGRMMRPDGRPDVKAQAEKRKPRKRSATGGNKGVMTHHS